MMLFENLNIKIATKSFPKVFIAALPTQIFSLYYYAIRQIYSFFNQMLIKVFKYFRFTLNDHSLPTILDKKNLLRISCNF